MKQQIVLGEDQLKAIEAIKYFLLLDEVAITITGFAGVGKTLILKEIVKMLGYMSTEYVLCAPTHKAKLVLERFTEREAITIHKLLAMAPNVEILNLDFKDLKFFMGVISLFPIGGVVICDEASMINDDLFDVLIDKCKKFKSKIIFSGDVRQLQPVLALTHSKVFTLSNLITLNKIYRQSSESGLTSVLPILRDRIIPVFSDSIGTEGSLLCTTDMKIFFSKIIPIFKKAIANGDILEAKILAYTNERVANFNYKTKELLFGLEKEYSQFEFLTAYENLEFNDTNFWNSMDYIIIDKPQEIDIQIPTFIRLPGYRLNLYDSSSKRSEEICILKRDVSKDYLDSLAHLIESTRIEAINLKQRRSKGSSQKWKEYYGIIGSFTTPMDIYYDGRLIRKKSFDYGYACTVHKSQGSSINNVFIDMKNVLKCRNMDELRQLQYVAVSRAQNNVYILQ